MLPSDRCDLDAPNTPWVFKNDEWIMLNGLCCSATAIRPNPPAQESLIELKQTVGKEKIAPFISKIDKGLMVAKIRYSSESIIAISTAYSFKDTNLTLAFYDANNAVIDQVQGLNRDSWPIESYQPFEVPPNTRSIDLILQASSHGVKCFNGFVLYLEQAYYDAYIVKHFENISVAAMCVSMGAIIVVPFLILIFGRNNIPFPIPINLLKRRKDNRISIVLFGIVAQLVFYTKGLFLILLLLWNGLLLYPLFLCYEQSHKLLGSILGVIVSAALFLQYIGNIVEAYYRELGFGRITTIMSNVPVVLFTFILIIYFLACMFSARASRSQEADDKSPPGFFATIRHPGEVLSYRRYKRDIVRYVEIPDMIHFTLATITLIIMQAVAFGNEMGGVLGEDMDTAGKVLLAMKASTFLSVLVGGFGIILFTSGVKYRFQRDLVQLRLGNYSLFHHRKGNDISMNDFLKFYGAAIGNAFFASLVVIIQLFLILILISAIVLIIPVRNFIVRWLLLSFLLPIFISWVISKLVGLITTLIFIIPGTKFWLRRRNGFMHWSFLAIFVHIPSGITGWVGRMIKAFFTIFMFSSRVDRNVLHVNLRSSDSGYNAYLGLLLSEHYYYNPINMVFLCLMLGKSHHEAPLKIESNSWRKLIRSPFALVGDKEDVVEEMKSITIMTARLESRRLVARNRWHLAYTLVNNPKLRDLRRHGESRSSKSESNSS
ncbi:hypothetical protein K493DRAFT_363692 [Basidiobolus meristosporus CBS 931.73]|uniref:Uncharacterized protein n=1 Tax=Basidiobolus meristosporus CBS 931.73 TaxID=1314790 RepID=A0A1Y1WSY7_9FUNG|nr:hypothetical protein K493DRAFT_363692 [Basidiobolus meristosporus CBS 931.73]|eukprot:ORX76505.1 hypothetical protein K493DRAFT_363692 [Basidiobolus meristosporus CBS 931.73]